MKYRYPKQHIVVILSIFMLPLMISCSGTPPVEIPVEEVKFRVSGMYCEGCVLAVETELQQIDGVTDVQVTLADSTVRFKVAQNKIPTNRELSDLMNELGYVAIFD